MTQWELNQQRLRLAGSTVESPLQRGHGGSVARWGVVGAVSVLLGILLLQAIALPSPWSALLIIVMTVPFVAMMVGNARRVLLGAAILDIPFQWGMHLNYDAVAGNQGAIGGLGISVTTASVAALYVLWLTDLLANRNARYNPWLRSALPLIAYVSVAALSILVARDPAFSYNEVFILVQTLLLFVYVASATRTRQDVLFLVTMLMLGLLLESLVIVATTELDPGLRIPGVTTRIEATDTAASPITPGARLSRAVGTLSSPNIAGSFLSLLMAPAFAILLARVGRARKALALLAFALGGLAIVLTFSRGGWIALGISLLVVSVVAVQRGWLSPVGPVAVLIAGAVLFAIFMEPILTRLADQEATAGRLPLIALAMSMIRAHPWLGVGSNNFYAVMPQYLTPEFAGAWLYVVHNKYLLVWAETGVFALIAFVAFLLSTVYTGRKVWSQGDSFFGPLALGFTAAVIGVMVHMGFDIFNGRPQVQALWLVAALLVAMRNVQAGEHSGAR